jgi:hypothetical protein
MDYWFTTSHGETEHVDPSTPDYVPGEPHLFPKPNINYREKCLLDGFARVGWPNAGDLKNNYVGRLAPGGYSFQSLEKYKQGYLRNFAAIKAGDYIIIPADSDSHVSTGVVHFGFVLSQDKKICPPYINPRPDAYYFYHDIANGDYYECAHRVNVKWARNENSEFAEYHIKNMGGIWRKAFSKINSNVVVTQLNSIARKAMLYQET